MLFALNAPIFVLCWSDSVNGGALFPPAARIAGRNTVPEDISDVPAGTERLCLMSEIWWLGRL